MQTHTVRYRSPDKLKDFILRHAIEDSRRLLVQIFAYTTDRKKIETVLEEVSRLFPSSTIVGTTTDGEVVDGRVISKDIILSFTQFEKTTLHAQTVTIEEENFETGRQIARSVSEETKVVLLFAKSIHIDAESLLRGIFAQGGDFIVAGGLSGDGGKFEDGFVFLGQQIVENGVVAVRLDSEDLIAKRYHTSQWEPVGREFTVTRSRHNRLISVDRMSVKALYAKYLGEEIAENLPLSGLQFPFLIERSGAFIARTPLWDPKDGSLIFGTGFREGEKIQIGFGDAEKMLTNVYGIIEKVAKEPVESLFVYASAGRRRFLKAFAHYEVEPLSQIAPVSGFYGYGEFSATAEEPLFLNQSFTLLSLSESADVKPTEVELKIPEDRTGDLQTLRALSNIAKVSSLELQELNQKLESRIREEVAKNRKKDSILIHNSKLAQMGEMMSLIAHQWRQPLSAISATSTGLHVKIELGKYDEAFFLSSLDRIEGYVKHLSATIDDFTDFFKPSKKLELTTTGALIKRALFIMSASLRKNSIDVMVDNSALSEFQTHPNEVVQVLINLIKNAENILIKREVEKPIITISAYERGRDHYIEVSDNAGGIDEKIIDKIFEPYFTTGNSEKSTGLGLYMSKFIIEESCHGKLSVKNGKEGAVFTIRLP